MAKLLLLAAVAVLAATAAALPKPDEKFTTKYDNVDIDKILENERLFGNYLNCILDKMGARCTTDANELKKAIPSALTNECAQCSEKQKEQSEKVIRFLIDKKPESWKELKTKYDPEGLYESRYAKRAEEHGVKV